MPPRISKAQITNECTNSNCKNLFHCRVECGTEHRACWCRECFMEGLSKAVDGKRFAMARIQDRFKCPVLTKNDKAKLILLLITGRIEDLTPEKE